MADRLSGRGRPYPADGRRNGSLKIVSAGQKGRDRPLDCGHGNRLPHQSSCVR